MRSGRNTETRRTRDSVWLSGFPIATPGQVGKPFMSGGMTYDIPSQVREILSKFQSSLYLPGLGVINGYTCGNYSDSAGTTAAVVDGAVGQVADAAGGGINATQATAGFKPTLRRGAVNLLTYSQDFSNALWQIANGASKVGAAPANSDPTGGSTAYRINVGVTGGTVGSAGAVYQRVPVMIGITYTYSVWIRSVTGTSPFRLSIFDVITDTGTADQTATTTWQQFTLTRTSAGTGVGSNVCIRAATAGGVVGDIYVAFPQFEIGSAASTYIPTTSAAASSSTGNYHLDYTAASSQYLSLGSVPWNYADDYSVIAGIKVGVVDSIWYGIFENGSGITDFSPGIWVSGGTGYLRVQAGTLTVDNSVACTAGESLVVSGVARGTNIYGRKNGTQFNTGTRPAGSNATFCGIGGKGNGSADFFQGAIYPLIAIKGTVSDADLLTLERWVGTLTGGPGVIF